MQHLIFGALALITTPKEVTVVGVYGPYDAHRERAICTSVDNTTQVCSVTRGIWWVLLECNHDECIVILTDDMIGPI